MTTHRLNLKYISIKNYDWKKKKKKKLLTFLYLEVKALHRAVCEHTEIREWIWIKRYIRDALAVHVDHR